MIIIKRNPNLRRYLERSNRTSKIKYIHPKCSINSNGKIPRNCVIHHLKPLRCGGTDRYSNLAAIPNESHKLIHKKRYSC